MTYSFSFFFLLFFIYSVIGYILEIISVSRKEKRLITSRGYFIGPYLPIFGVGTLLMICLLQNYRNDIFVIFVMSFTVCSVLEYVTSYIMEKIFHLRWWDYSDRKFHINGRVCLNNSFLFGLMGIVIVKYFNPILVSYLLLIPKDIIIILSSLLFIIMLGDLILSSYCIWRLKLDTTMLICKDSTAIVKKKVKESLLQFQFFHRRLLIAFPSILSTPKFKSLREIIGLKSK